MKNTDEDIHNICVYIYTYGWQLVSSSMNFLANLFGVKRRGQHGTLRCKAFRCKQPAVARCKHCLADKVVARKTTALITVQVPVTHAPCCESYLSASLPCSAAFHLATCMAGDAFHID